MAIRDGAWRLCERWPIISNQCMPLTLPDAEVIFPRLLFMFTVRAYILLFVQIKANSFYFLCKSRFFTFIIFIGCSSLSYIRRCRNISWNKQRIVCLYFILYQSLLRKYILSSDPSVTDTVQSSSVFFTRSRLFKSKGFVFFSFGLLFKILCDNTRYATRNVSHFLIKFADINTCRTRHIVSAGI